VGRRERDLISIRLAAITRNSPQMFGSIAWMRERYWQYCSVMRPMGMSKMSTSSFFRR